MPTPTKSTPFLLKLYEHGLEYLSNPWLVTVARGLTQLHDSVFRLMLHRYTSEGRTIVWKLPVDHPDHIKLFLSQLYDFGDKFPDHLLQTLVFVGETPHEKNAMYAATVLHEGATPFIGKFIMTLARIPGVVFDNTADIYYLLSLSLISRMELFENPNPTSVPDWYFSDKLDMEQKMLELMTDEILQTDKEYKGYVH